MLCPLSDDDVIQDFADAIANAQAADYTPPDYGLLVTDHNYQAWDAHITIEVARKAEKILLPTAVWEPRARQWIRGLHFLTELTMDDDQD